MITLAFTCDNDDKGISIPGVESIDFVVDGQHIHALDIWFVDALSTAAREYIHELVDGGRGTNDTGTRSTRIYILCDAEGAGFFLNGQLWELEILNGDRQ